MWFQQSPPPKVPTSSLPAEGLHKPWHRSDARGAPFPALNGIASGNLTYEKWGIFLDFHGFSISVLVYQRVPKKIHVSLQTAVFGMVIYWLPCHEQNVIPSSQYETSPLYDMVPKIYIGFILYIHHGFLGVRNCKQGAPGARSSNWKHFMAYLGAEMSSLTWKEMGWKRNPVDG